MIFNMIYRLISLALFARAAIELFIYSYRPPGSSLGGYVAFSGLDRFYHFADLQVISFNGAGCEEPISTIYEKSCYFHPWGVNVPTTLIRLLRLIGVGEANHIHIGFTLGLAAMCGIICIYWICLKPWQCCLGIALTISSFPLRLALERGNIDLLILCLLLLGCAAFSNGGLEKRELLIRLYYLSGISIFAFAGASKVYPLTLLPLLLIYFACSPEAHRPERFWPTRTAFALLTLISSIVVIVFLLPDIPEMLRSSYADMSGGLSYGLQTFPGVQDSFMLYSIIRFAAIAIVVALSFSNNEFRMYFGAYYVAKKAVHCMRAGSWTVRYSAIMYITGAFLFIATYFLFTNGIYRLAIPLVMCMPLLLKCIKPECKHKQCGSDRLLSIINSGVAGRLLIVGLFAIVSYAGYRPYASSSNIQHLTSLYICWVAVPCIIAFLTSSMIGILRTCWPGRQSQHKLCDHHC